MPEGAIYELWCERVLEINPHSEIQNKDNTHSECTKVRKTVPVHLEEVANVR